MGGLVLGVTRPPNTAAALLHAFPIAHTTYVVRGGGSDKTCAQNHGCTTSM